MNHEFWHDKWQKQQIGFHEPKANPLLLAHLKALDLAPSSKIFLPLCGKTLDIAWLLAQGFEVVGAELNKLAVCALFEEMHITPTISECGALTRYSAKGLDIYLGDIFALQATTLGPVAAIYDRAALIALPETMRRDYSKHIRNLTGTAKQLLITVEYDQSLQAGPPFNVSAAEVAKHYEPFYKLDTLAVQSIKGGLKGKCAANEHVWLLTPL